MWEDSVTDAEILEYLGSLRQFIPSGQIRLRKHHLNYIQIMWSLFGEEFTIQSRLYDRLKDYELEHVKSELQYTIKNEQNKIFNEIYPIDIDLDYVLADIDLNVLDIDIRRWCENNQIYARGFVRLNNHFEFQTTTKVHLSKVEYHTQYVKAYIVSHLIRILGQSNIHISPLRIARVQETLLSSQERYFSGLENLINRGYQDEYYEIWSQPCGSHYFPQEAQQKAEKLLLGCLTKEQKRQYAQNKSFIVVGNITGIEYKIHPLSQINIEILTGKQQGKKACVVPTESIPIADHQLAQKLMIENNEDMFLKKVIYWN